MITQFILLIILVFLSALFSGIETAVMSLNRIKVQSLLKKKRRGAEALHRVKQNPHRLLITILVGNNLVNISAASFATVVFTNLFGSSGVGIATGIMTLLILVFGEITPKTFATQNAERISLLVARPMEILSVILYPIIRILEIIAKAMSAILGSKKEQEISEDDVRSIVTMGAEHGVVNEEAAEMMKNVLAFKKITAKKVMTRRSQLQMVQSIKSIKDVLNFVVKSRYSRFPTYNSSKEKVLGILDVDDVLRSIKNNELNTKIRHLTKKAYFIPESKQISELLKEFEKKRMRMAVVVDEYGAVSGVVTLDDILEEIVGDIFDKSQRSSVLFKKLDKNLIRVDAKASVEEVNEQLHLGLRQDHFNTFAGFVEHKLQRIPKRGEIIQLQNVKLKVTKVTKQGIQSIHVIKT